MPPLNKPQFEKKKAGRKELNKPYTSPKNVPELKVRVMEIEKFVGITSDPT